jgi:HEAT repeat protein
MSSASQDNTPDVNRLLQDLQDDRFWVREQAAEALGYSASQAAIAGLLHALEDKTSTVRERAAEALARIGSEPALTGLLGTLGNEKVAAMLTPAGSKEVSDQRTDRLHQALRHDHYAQRWQAAQALWKLEGAQAIEALLQALQEPEPKTPDQIRQDPDPASIADRPDEDTLFDALSRQDFQTAWHLAQDLVQMDAEYAAMIFERVLDLTT